MQKLLSVAHPTKGLSRQRNMICHSGLRSHCGMGDFLVQSQRFIHLAQ